jgi:hypothetical protein
MKSLKVFLVLFVAFFLSGLFTVSCFAARYVDNADGTVTDTKTKLMWQWGDDGEMRPMDRPVSAADYCGQLTLGDNDDWRLPRIDELRDMEITYLPF